MDSAIETSAVPSRRTSLTLAHDEPHDIEKDVKDLDVDEPTKLQAYALPSEAVAPTEEEEYPEGGRGWFVVAGAFINASLVLGWPLVWGVFQQYYKEHVFPQESETTLALLGTIQNMMMTFTAFISGKLGDRFGYKPFIVAGSVISCIGLLSAAFSKGLWQYFISQGVLPGLANGMMFPMVVSYPSMWFKKRRALATGIVVAGSSFGGGASSLIVRALLTKIGLRYTLLFYLGLNIVGFIVSFLLLKSRGPRRNVKIVWVDRSLLGDLVFWSLALTMTFAPFGYLPPIIYLTTYTAAKIPGISPQMAVAPTAVMNFSSAIGRTIVGLTADRIGVTNAFIGSILISATAQLVIWNLAESYAVIMVFSVIVGAFGGCFISLLAPVIAQIFGTSRLATLSGMLIMFNLPGNIASSPLAGTILSSTNQNWHAVIAYSGGIQLLAVIIFLYARFKRQPKVFTRF